MVIAEESPQSEEFRDQSFIEAYKSAIDLYGLVHSRFILSPRGLELMKRKYLFGTFGVCPRTSCLNQNVMPIGLNDTLSTARVKIYCPKCEDMYIPKKKIAELDGAFFGTSFPQALLQSYPDLVPVSGPQPFIPKMFGFKLYGLKGSAYDKSLCKP